MLPDGGLECSHWNCHSSFVCITTPTTASTVVCTSSNHGTLCFSCDMDSTNSLWLLDICLSLLLCTIDALFVSNGICHNRVFVFFVRNVSFTLVVAALVHRHIIVMENSRIWKFLYCIAVVPTPGAKMV